MASKTDKQQVRHKQLMRLRAANADMSDSEFSERLGLPNPSYFSRLKSWPREGSKRIGDACRDWEERFELPVGWFDQDGDSPPPPRHTITQGALRVALTFDDMDKAERVAVEQAIAKILRKREQKSA
jgi:hypothetical protein